MNNLIDISLAEQNYSLSEAKRWSLNLTSHAVNSNESEKFSIEIRFGKQNENLISKSLERQKLREQLRNKLAHSLYQSETVHIKYDITIERNI